MNSKYIARHYNNFNTNVNMGSNVVAFFKQFIPSGSVITEIAAFQITVSALHTWLPNFFIPIYIIIIFVIGKYYAWILLNYLIGRTLYRLGIWRSINDGLAKADHLNPFNVETAKTLKAICKKLKIKDSFTEL